MALLEATPDLTIAELRKALAETGVTVGYGTIRRLYARHGITRKKKMSTHASEEDRPDVLKHRQAWFDGRLDLDADQLVFFDETWASTDMARRQGRCRRGERLPVGVLHGHWKTTIFVAGLTTRGMVAPWVLDGPISCDAFETWIGQVLIPRLMPSDVVIMDNLSSHKGPRVREMIEAAGAELRYLPPPDQVRGRLNSPDSNPIENASPGSRPCCARRPSAPSTVSGPPSAASSTSSRRTSAETTSPTPGTMRQDRLPL